MKRYILSSFSALFILVACNNESHEGSHSSDSSSTNTTHHNTDTALNNTSGSQTSMMQIMMQMDEAMKNTTLSGDADRDFAQLMKVHHQSAVEMAQLEVAQGTDTTIKRMAQKMITDQQKEITAFDQFLQSGKTGTSSEAFKKELMASMKTMDHSQHGTGAVDQQFLAMMIPHHQGAIDMAKPYIQYAKDPGLKAIAQTIITTQQAEIKQLQSLQKEEHQH